MSRLKLYWPEARGQAEAAGIVETEPAVIPFGRLTNRCGAPVDAGPVNRAHVIFANSRCPTCRHPVVQPLELNDALLGRSNLPVPGTATLVGFRCERCDIEWPA